MNREQRFFNQIEEVLHSYKEEYIPGAWEEFSSEKRNRKRALRTLRALRALFIWRLAGAAAVLLLFIYISFEFFNINTLPKKSRTKTPSNQEILSKANDKNVTNPNEEQGTADQGQIRFILKRAQPKTGIIKEVVPMRKIQHSARADTNIFAKKATEKYLKDKIITSEIAKIGIENKIGLNQRLDLPDTGKFVANKGILKKLPFWDNVKYREKTDIITYDSLTNRNNAAVKSRKNSRNVFYAFVLSPSLGNQKLNFGTGVEISYKIGNNLSFNGGVMYSSMNAGGNRNDNGTGNKKLQDVELKISGLEVPVGLQYQIKGGFYATAGISGLSVISDRLEYNYLTQTTQTITVVSGGAPRDIITVVLQESTEQSREKIRNYIGFYTFSMGTKKAFGSNHLNIGPFIKIPFGNVSSEKIKLMHGGFRLSLDF